MQQALVVPVLLAPSGRRSSRTGAVLGGLAFLGLVVLVLTWSRGAWVAAAVAACLTPEDQVRCADLAWSTAMNARMARVCESVADGCGTQECETEKQYEILSRYLETL